MVLAKLLKKRDAAIDRPMLKYMTDEKLREKPKKFLGPYDIKRDFSLLQPGNQNLWDFLRYLRALNVHTKASESAARQMLSELQLA